MNWCFIWWLSFQNFHMPQSSFGALWFLCQKITKQIFRHTRAHFYQASLYSIAVSSRLISLSFSRKYPNCHQQPNLPFLFKSHLNFIPMPVDSGLWFGHCILLKGRLAVIRGSTLQMSYQMWSFIALNSQDFSNSSSCRDPDSWMQVLAGIDFMIHLYKEV